MARKMNMVTLAGGGGERGEEEDSISIACRT